MGEDFVDFFLLNSHHVHRAVFLNGTLLLGLTHIPSQGLVEGNLVESLISSGCDRTCKDIDKVVFLDDVRVSEVVVALKKNV